VIGPVYPSDTVMNSGIQSFTGRSWKAFSHATDYVRGGWMDGHDFAENGHDFMTYQTNPNDGNTSSFITRYTYYLHLATITTGSDLGTKIVRI
jgi:hypothetical protein